MFKESRARIQKEAPRLLPTRLLFSLWTLGSTEEPILYAGLWIPQHLSSCLVHALANSHPLPPFGLEEKGHGKEATQALAPGFRHLGRWFWGPGLWYGLEGGTGASGEHHLVGLWTFEFFVLCR